MQNQSNSLITFDTQLKTALKLSTSAQLNHINSISCIFVRLMVLEGQGSKNGFVVMLVPHTSADRGANPEFEGRLNFVDLKLTPMVFLWVLWISTLRKMDSQLISFCWWCCAPRCHAWAMFCTGRAPTCSHQHSTGLLSNLIEPCPERFSLGLQERVISNPDIILHAQCVTRSLVKPKNFTHYFLVGDLVK